MQGAVPINSSVAEPRMWIKICGMTTVEAVAAAVDCHVDAVGFVFAESRRQVTAEQARILAADVPAGIARIAVMLHPTQAELDAVLKIFQPDVVQTDHADLATLEVPAGVTVLPVLRQGARFPEPAPARVLFEGPVSGTGSTADWTRAAQLATRTELILAGGLNRDNVGVAIERVHPFGIDVSSGVESSPGIKSPELIRAFVSAARSAAGKADRI